MIGRIHLFFFAILISSKGKIVAFFIFSNFEHDLKMQDHFALEFDLMNLIYHMNSKNLI
jgi:hypothetical protein